MGDRRRAWAEFQPMARAARMATSTETGFLMRWITTWMETGFPMIRTTTSTATASPTPRTTILSARWMRRFAAKQDWAAEMELGRAMVREGRTAKEGKMAAEAEVKEVDREEKAKAATAVRAAVLVKRAEARAASKGDRFAPSTRVNSSPAWVMALRADRVAVRAANREDRAAKAASRAVRVANPGRAGNKAASRAAAPGGSLAGRAVAVRPAAAASPAAEVGEAAAIP